tara:strand:- start:589 stop:1059 length:471 start_codon:yes stop_codon:yes gene_type:complete
MKYIKFLIILFISINTSIIADSKQIIINELNLEGKLIFIRHAYAPGGGDPINFNIKDCSTQRNLNNAGKEQAKRIGNFFKENNILIEKVYSSEWCRCKETALVAFNNFEEKSFLNSFFSSKFKQNKNHQMKSLKEFIKNWNGKKKLSICHTLRGNF